METFLDQVGQLTMHGHVELARELLEQVRATNPLSYYLGHAMVAAVKNDAQQLSAYAMTAQHYAPDDPFVAHTLTMMHVQAGDLAAAEREAKRALQLDGSARSWRGLANVYVLAGRHQDAERTLREGLSRHEDPEARLALGGVRAARGDQAGAIEQLAKAWVGDPTDSRPMQQAIQLYREAGWMFGVVMLSRVTRGGSHPPEVNTMLDAMAIEVLRVIDQSPLKDIINVSEDAVKGLLDQAPQLPPFAQLRIARTLVETGRKAEAMRIVDRVAATELQGRELAEVAYLRGVVKSQTGDLPGAIAEYREAAAAYPAHWEAACNAVNVCLRLGDAASLVEAGHFIDNVPLVVRRLNPFMTFNEATWLNANARDVEATALLRFLRESPPGPLEGAIASLEQSIALRTGMN